MKRNRTSKYLYQTLNSFGNTFLKEFKNRVSFVTGITIDNGIKAVGISDSLWYEAKNINYDQLKDNPYLFIVIDTRGPYNERKDLFFNPAEGKKRFGLFLKYVRTNKHYIDDYWFDNNQHCIVISINDFQNAYCNFICSRYSKMYTNEELKTIKFPKTKAFKGKEYLSAEWVVLTKYKPDEAKQVLQKAIYESYGVNFTPDNPDEYDIPWMVEDEILNNEYLTEEQIKLIKLTKSEKN